MSAPDPTTQTSPSGELPPAEREGYPEDVAFEFSHAVPAGFAPGTGRRLARAALALALVMLLAFGGVQFLRAGERSQLAMATEQAATAPPRVDVVLARPVSAQQALTLPGQTAAWNESAIYARVSGYVDRWLVDIGDPVRKGQTLAVIDSPALDAQLSAARAALLAAEAQVAVREAELNFAVSTDARWRDSPQGVVSEQERSAKRADREGAEARLKAAHAEVALDRAKVNQYLALSRFKQVIAPFDGVIRERRVEIGNLVTADPSSQGISPLYRITQNHPIRVFADLPQSVAADLMRPGTPAEVLAEGRSYKGQVARSADALNSQSRTLRIEVDLPNADDTLVPGMYVRVAFTLPAKGTVEVPAAAMLFRAGGPQVARVDAEGRIRFGPVRIARDDGLTLELGSGVAAGDRLVLNISSQIAEGDRVQVNEAGGAEAVPPPDGARPAAPGR